MSAEADTTGLDDHVLPHSCSSLAEDIDGVRCAGLDDLVPEEGIELSQQ